MNHSVIHKSIIDVNKTVKRWALVFSPVNNITVTMATDRNLFSAFLRKASLTNSLVISLFKLFYEHV